MDPQRGYAFMKAHRAEFPLAAMCRVPGLSSSGYYDWLKRPPSARARRDADLEARTGAIWTGSGETYGRPRIHAALGAEGERVGQKRVGRLMRTMRIEGATGRRWKTATTKRDAEARPAPDLVRRDFSASGPDRLWVADITYVPAWAGWLYLAVVLDVWSRRVVGWAMATRMRTELVEAALAMALARRRPEGRVVHHSDSEFVRAGSLR
ncbi:IS3 family transposase [Candidatus Palauibacter sp.]|uniref:IS3 family transposase n=1 Tax=Candidatus Palauibacter sp. TaxID=3101350 RepID=UPI003B5BA5A4